jgi:hypothetical protein
MVDRPSLGLGAARLGGSTPFARMACLFSLPSATRHTLALYTMTTSSRALTLYTATPLQASPAHGIFLGGTWWIGLDWIGLDWIGLTQPSYSPPRAHIHHPVLAHIHHPLYLYRVLAHIHHPLYQYRVLGLGVPSATAPPSSCCARVLTPILLVVPC